MPPALPEAAFELALWELLKAMLASRGDTMPTIRMMFFTQGTVKATLLEKRTDAATNPQLEIIVKSSCDKAVPIIKHIMGTLVDVVDPNMNDLRSVITGILQDRCAEAVRGLHANRGTPEEWAEQILSSISAALKNAQDQLSIGVAGVVQEAVDAERTVTSLSPNLPELIKSLCAEGVSTRCAKACTTTKDELTARLAEAMNQSPQQSLRRDDGEEVDVGDVSVEMVRSANIAAAVGRAAAAEEARERLRNAHTGGDIEELQGAIEGAQRALDDFSNSDDEVLPFMIELAETRLAELRERGDLSRTASNFSRATSIDQARSPQQPGAIPAGLPPSPAVPSPDFAPSPAIIQPVQPVQPVQRLSRAQVAAMTDEERLAAAMKASMEEAARAMEAMEERNEVTTI